MSDNVYLKSHRIDIILPGKGYFTVPAVPEFKGKKIILEIQKRNISNFVICQNIQSEQVPRVLYSDIYHETISKLINSNKPFETLSATELFIPNRILGSEFQRSSLYVYYINKYLELLEISKVKYTPRKLLVSGSSLPAKVKLPTNLVVTISIKITRN